MVYPFENDESVVDEMRVALEKANVSMARVSADRICREPTITVDGVVGESEDYYRVLINDESVGTRALFSTADRDDRHSVIFMANVRQFQWEWDAKRLLVNGGHFAYVVYAFRRLNRLFPDRRDLVKLFVEEPVTELLFSQDVRDALGQIADLYVVHLLIKAESAGLVASGSDVERLFGHLMKLRDAFGERLASTRDEISRILKPRATTIHDRVRRFTTCLESLGPRLRDTKFAAKFYEQKGLDMLTLERDAIGFQGACVELFSYIGASESQA